MENTLEIYQGEKMIYSNVKKWLYPLFDLEIFINKNSINPEKLFLKDKIIGKAAAILIVRMGIKSVYTKIISRPAKEYFEINKIKFEYDEMIEKVKCMTESMFEKINDIEEGYKILKERAGYR